MQNPDIEVLGERLSLFEVVDRQEECSESSILSHK